MDIQLHPEYLEAKRRIEVLKNDVTELFTEHSELVTVEVPAAEALYMDKIGRFELVAYELYMQVQFLKKRRQLMLQAINRREAPDKERIEKELEKLAKKLNVKRQKMVDQLDRAKAWQAATMLSEEDTAEAHVLYKQLVKLLHPDLHPNQTRQEAEWFKQAVDAYKAGDLAKLQLISELVAVGTENDTLSFNAIEELHEQIRRLEAHAESLTHQILMIKDTFPMTTVEWLKDEEWVAAQLHKIQHETAILTKRRDDLRQELVAMGWQPNEQI